MMFFAAQAGAQIPFLSSGELGTAVSKVIKDYPNYFSNIKGDTILKTPQSIDFACTIVIPGAEAGTITMSGPAKDQVFSWKNTLFETEDFGKAKAKFRQYYTQLKKTTSTLGDYHVTLQGDFEEPSEDKKFTTVIFRVEHSPENYRNLVVDLSLQYEISGWEITVSVYEKTSF